MALMQAQHVQAQPAADETDLYRYVYDVQDPLKLFRSLTPTLSELEPGEVSDIESTLSSKDFAASDEGLDIFWPIESDDRDMPALCSIYFTPYGVCLDVMSHNDEDFARERFEKYLSAEDTLAEVTFIPVEMMSFRIFEEDGAIGDLDDDGDDDLDEDLEEN